MAILTAAVLLVFLTAFLDRTSVDAKLVYVQRSGHGCPLFGMACSSHCKHKHFSEGYCGGSGNGACLCSGCKLPSKKGCK
ncbi:defensin BmKDfsin6-like [Rhipicephalus microplus]|uniref:defensin BmKDfsin6-like n=1 Tax=Rhipicephalus microplus TaxID=6941 RepID=UPI002376A6C0